MNYRAMAQAIRAERRAIWVGLGKPEATPRFVFKRRQHGHIAVAQAVHELIFGPKPWHDFQWELTQDKVLARMAEHLELQRELGEGWLNWLRRTYPLEPKDCYHEHTTDTTVEET